MSEPGRAGVADDVRGDVRQPCGFGDMAKRLIAVLDGASVPFNREGLAPPFPAAQVRQEAARQWDPAVRPMRKDA